MQICRLIEIDNLHLHEPSSPGTDSARVRTRLPTTARREGVMPQRGNGRIWCAEPATTTRGHNALDEADGPAHQPIRHRITRNARSDPKYTFGAGTTHWGLDVERAAGKYPDSAVVAPGIRKMLPIFGR